MRSAATLMLLGVVSLAGCRASLPRTPSEGPADALDRIARRVDGIRALSAQGVMTMRSDEGETVRLRIAVAVEGADRMRLRAWKLGHAALDMTVRDDAVWLWVGGDKADGDKGSDEKASDGEAGREEAFFSRFFLRRRFAWHVLRGGLPDHAAGRIEDQAGSKFRVSIPMRGEGAATLVATVDRPTLTVRAYELNDSSGGTDRRVRIPSYRLVSGTPLPVEIRAEGERGTLTLELEKMTVNPELNSAAFEPPQRAEKLQGTPAERSSDR